MAIKCCLGCTERTEKCHSTCKRYTKERDEHVAELRARKSADEAGRYLCGTYVRHKDVIAKYKRRRKNVI